MGCLGSTGRKCRYDERAVASDLESPMIDEHVSEFSKRANSGNTVEELVGTNLMVGITEVSASWNQNNVLIDGSNRRSQTLLLGDGRLFRRGFGDITERWMVRQSVNPTEHHKYIVKVLFHFAYTIV